VAIYFTFTTATNDANSHIACRAHAVPLPCRASKGLECVFPIRKSSSIWFTQCGRVWFTLAMPCACRTPTMKATSQGHGTARHGMCELTSAVERRPVGYLPAFGFFRLPCRVPQRLLQEAYQSQMQVASVKPNNVCHGQWKAYHFSART